jgi:hypothetical protein
MGRGRADVMTYIRHIGWILMYVWLKNKDVIPGLLREEKRIKIRVDESQTRIGER